MCIRDRIGGNPVAVGSNPLQLCLTGGIGTFRRQLFRQRAVSLEVQLCCIQRDELCSPELIFQQFVAVIAQFDLRQLGLNQLSQPTVAQLHQFGIVGGNMADAVVGVQIICKNVAGTLLCLRMHLSSNHLALVDTLPFCPEFTDDLPLVIGNDVLVIVTVNKVGDFPSVDLIQLVCQPGGELRIERCGPCGCTHLTNDQLVFLNVDLDLRDDVLSLIHI